MALTCRTRRLLTTGAALVLLAAAGCEAADPAPRGGSAPPSPAAALVVKDPWVKAAPSGMTAAFGVLTNTTDRDLVVASAASAAARTMELHETATVDGAMAMRPKAGGFTVPARGSHQLRPGGDHLMLMDLTGPVQPGAEVVITLTLGDGGTVTFTAVGKEFAAGNESYRPSPGAPASSPAGRTSMSG